MWTSNCGVCCCVIICSEKIKLNYPGPSFAICLLIHMCGVTAADLVYKVLHYKSILRKRGESNQVTASSNSNRAGTRKAKQSEDEIEVEYVVVRASRTLRAARLNRAKRLS
jgi:hypothetical protein